MTTPYSAADVQAHLTAALNELLHRDLFLLQHDVHERTISHRLGMYLEGRFNGWAVDCEYNRCGETRTSKILDEVHAHIVRELQDRPALADNESLTVFPDIIVHERGRGNNLLVIELKKHTSEVDSAIDLAKLRGYRESEHLRYANAAFVLLYVGKQAGRPAEVQWQ